MGAAAEFHRVAVQRVAFAADLDDADDLAVFVAEELHDVLAVLDRGVRDLGPGNGHVLFDGAVDHFLHHGDLFCCERRAVEVEAQAVFIDGGALLGGVFGNGFVKRPVEQVGGGVVCFDRAAAGGVELEGDFFAYGNLRFQI